MGRINPGIKTASRSASLGSTVYYSCRHMLYGHPYLLLAGIPLLTGPHHENWGRGSESVKLGAGLQGPGGAPAILCRGARPIPDVDATILSNYGFYDVDPARAGPHGSMLRDDRAPELTKDHGH